MKLHEKIENGKRQLANRLSTVSEQYSTTAKKRILLIAGLAFACICLSMIISPFQADTIQLKEGLQMPVVIVPPSEEPLLSDEDYKIMKGFIKTMDSLKRFDQNTYQDAMKGREGLIDSILFLLRHTGETLIQK